MKKIKLITKCVTSILIVCYPFIIYLSIQNKHINLAILCLIILFLIRLVTLPNLISNIKWTAKIIACIGVILALTSWLFSKYQLLLYYPVMVNVVLFVFFSYSLSQPQTIIETFARIKNPDLSVDAIQYTRKVTIFWCLFFVFNGTVALITCLINNTYWWTIYNGLISYVLIGVFMGGEWLLRRRIQK
jgi:uncharacterized membrane protein